MSRRCANCDGTGKLVLMKSWFPSDGYRRERCGICGGTGRSAYRPAPDAVKQQKDLRAAYLAQFGTTPEER